MKHVEYHSSSIYKKRGMSQKVLNIANENVDVFLALNIRFINDQENLLAS